MSLFSGKQEKGAMRVVRERKRKEAEERKRTARLHTCGHKHTPNGSRGCNSLLGSYDIDLDQPMTGASHG